MATTNFNDLSVRLSMMVDDPVAAADTDGSELTAALRTAYLNRANRAIQGIVWGAGEGYVQKYMQGLVAIDTTATTSGYKTVPSGFSFALGFQKASGGRATYFPPEAKPDLDNNSNPNATLAYTVLAGTIYAYENGAAISNGSHPFYYVKSDQITVVTGAGGTDLAIDAIWWDVMVDLAASYHFTDKGDTKQAGLFLTRALETIKSILR